MQLTNLALIAAALTPLASANCYGAGLAMWRKDLKYHASRACKGYDGKRGAFQGYFKPNERTEVCVNNGVGKIIMEVGNLNPNVGFDIKDSDCEKELHRVIDNCYLPIEPELSRGGRDDNHFGWTFRVDPNDGKC